MASINQTRSKGPALQAEHDGVPRGHVTEIQRARMLSAAVDAIEENGYARLTVAQVIGRAKVSRKTFYDLFVDRDDCFLAVFERTLEQIRARVVEAYGQETTWREKIRAGLASLLVFIDEEPELARLCIVDALGGGARVLEERARILDQLRQVIDQGRTAATVKREPPSVTAEGVIGAAFAVIHTRLLERSPKPYIGLHGSLMSMIVLPYLGVRAASRELSRPAPDVRRRGIARPGRDRGPSASLQERHAQGPNAPAALFRLGRFEIGDAGLRRLCRRARCARPRRAHAVCGCVSCLSVGAGPCVRGGGVRSNQVD